MHLISIHPLVQDSSIETVADVVKILHERRILESDVKAKIEFPELFPIAWTAKISIHDLKNRAFFMSK